MSTLLGKKVFKQVTENGMPSLGKTIHEHLRSRNINANRLSLSINRDSSALAKFKKRQSFQTAILWELCFALKYNFFADLASQLPTDFEQKPNAFLQEMDSLKKENELLKQNLELLKDMFATNK